MSDQKKNIPKKRLLSFLIPEKRLFPHTDLSIIGTLEHTRSIKITKTDPEITSLCCCDKSKIKKRIENRKIGSQ